jgi:hypothetical protein
MTEPPRLDEARRELVRLGYLSHRFERFLLQDALVARGRARGLVVLAGKVGLAAGSLLAAGSTLALGLGNRLFGSAPGELPLLFLHLAPPVVLGTALAFLAVVGLLRGLLAAFPRRGPDFARLGAALGAAAALVSLAVGFGGELLRGLPRLERVAAAAALTLLAGAVAKLVADGLLAFEIRWTRHVPHERLVSRRTLTVALAVSAAAVGLAALASGPRAAPSRPAALPVSAGERVLLVGVDGVLPDELDYLLARGELPALARLGSAGGVVAAYERAAAISPAELWTTVATGRDGADHGVVALDGWRPAGMATALARLGVWRGWFADVAAPLGLAEQRPLLSGRRRAPAAWELVARGGRPVAAVDWWGTYPAEPLPGLVVAHGAWGQLGADDAAAVAPSERRAELIALRERLRSTPAPGTGPRIDELALAPDRFYREAARLAAPASRAVALYLPAPDLAASDGVAGAELAALVRAELVATDRLVGELATSFATVVVVVDPGRRGGASGRVVLSNGRCTASARPRLDLREIAPALLRAAGLPQSAELLEPPSFCDWREPSARVATYGERPPAPSGTEGGEYLETLRSLGYL